MAAPPGLGPHPVPRVGAHLRFRFSPAPVAPVVGRGGSDRREQSFCNLGLTQPLIVCTVVYMNNNNNTTTAAPTMSAKTRAAQIRTAIRAAGIAELPGVAKITVKTSRASLMTAIDVKVHTTGPARAEVPDEHYGSVWKLSPLAAAAVAAIEDLDEARQADEDWGNGQTTFFGVEAVQVAA